MNKNFVIGVEGEVGAGKTSMCRELVKIIPNTILIDGGAIFRGIILAIKKYRDENNVEINLKNNNETTNETINENSTSSNNNITNNIVNSKINKKINTVDAFELMQRLKVEFKIIDNQTIIYIDGKEIDESKIETMENSMSVSKFAGTSDNKALFQFAHNIIKEYNKKYNVIVSARDLVEIYPEMDLHLFITASIEERTKRRYKQYNGKYSYDEIRQIIEARDELHKRAGFNKISDRTVTVDLSDCKSAIESAKKAIEVLHKYSLV